MLYEAPGFGPRLLKDLTVNDSWIKRTYIKVGEAGRELGRFNFDDTSILERANKLQQDVLDMLPCEGVSARPIDPKKAAMLEDFISSYGGGLIFMRHGVQFIEDEERRNLTGPTRKIRLMQMPFNNQDPADAQSLAEAASLAVLLSHIGKKSNIPVDIKTSGNTRAADIGAVISVLNGFQVGIDDRLTCVNYPTDKSDEELEELLGRDSMGALEWKREILDGVCGDGTFGTIDGNMREVIDQYNGMDRLMIFVTHTPQTNAVDVITGDFPTRMPELGFRIMQGQNSLRFPNNLFK